MHYLDLLVDWRVFISLCGLGQQYLVNIAAFYDEPKFSQVYVCLCVKTSLSVCLFRNAEVRKGKREGQVTKAKSTKNRV